MKSPCLCSDIAVVHLDADWDCYRLEVEQQINEIITRQPTDVMFAYVDVDEQPNWLDR
jgi:hypothetical protein